MQPRPNNSELSPEDRARALKGYTTTECTHWMAETHADLPGIKVAAVELLSRQSTLTPGILRKVAEKLESGDDDELLEAAIEIFRDRSPLKPEIFDEIARILENGPKRFYYGVTEALKHHTPLLPEILHQITEWLRHAEFAVLQSIIEVLEDDSDLTQELCRRIVVLVVARTDYDFRDEAIQILRSLSALPMEIAQEMALLLKDCDNGYSSDQNKDEDGDEDEDASQIVLGLSPNQTNSSPNFVKDICKLLDDEDWVVQREANSSHSVASLSYRQLFFTE